MEKKEAKYAYAEKGKTKGRQGVLVLHTNVCMWSAHMPHTSESDHLSQLNSRVLGHMQAAEHLDPKG